MLFHQRQKCFCAFCKTPRNIYTSKYLSIFAIIGLSALSLISSLVLWQNLDARGLFIFAPLLLVGELFAQAKWRKSMICSNCGFDVIMYKQNPEKCGDRIREHLSTRSERPEFLLRSMPQIPKSAYKSTDKKGDKLSLQV